jgi:Acetyl-CoA dehydrogenase C-terminal like/Acyl-CoA dehydrogenase, C-terminal domain
VKLALHADRALALAESDGTQALYHEGQVDLLTPVLKAYGADQAFRIAEMALQIYGGAGYVEDNPVEQYLRDAKIFSIYEGTNHIQALDLVARKLGTQGGEPFQALLRDIGVFVAAHAHRPALATEVGALSQAAEALKRAASAVLELFVGGKLDQVTLVANWFLEILAEVAIAHLLLEAAVIAEVRRASLDEERPERADFYRGKVAAAKHFVHCVLPAVHARAGAIVGGDRSALEVPDAGFSSAR